MQVEKLGRQRPEVFKTMWHEFGFCFSLLASMLMAVCYTSIDLRLDAYLCFTLQEYFISGFNIVLPVLADALDIPEQSRTWPASIFSLITGSLLLPVGRLTDMYGGYILFTFGLTWFFIWSLIGGFSQNYTMLILCRALQGIGAAAFLPSGIMLLGKIYRPGPRKNLIFSLYGASSPLGFFSGIFFGGLSGEVFLDRCKSSVCNDCDRLSLCTFGSTAVAIAESHNGLAGCWHYHTWIDLGRLRPHRQLACSRRMEDFLHPGHISLWMPSPWCCNLHRGLGCETSVIAF